MILSDLEIFERLLDDEPDRRLVITPIVSLARQLGPNSFDVRLGTDFVVFQNTRHVSFDPLAENARLDRDTKEYTVPVQVAPLEPFVLHPGEFALGTTLEQVCLPGDIAATLEGKSTWARLGLEIHSTAGFVDSGFSGKLTFEMKNNGKMPILLYAGTLMAQICFVRTGLPAIKTYAKRGKYQHQLTVQPARLSRDKELNILRKGGARGKD